MAVGTFGGPALQAAGNAKLSQSLTLRPLPEESGVA
jgi:hypothetical protein